MRALRNTQPGQRATTRAAESRAALLAAAERWEHDAGAEEARAGARGDIGYGRASVMRSIAAGLRDLATGLEVAGREVSRAA